jgi:hypothetical protein
LGYPVGHTELWDGVTGAVQACTNLDVVSCILRTSTSVSNTAKDFYMKFSLC